MDVIKKGYHGEVEKLSRKCKWCCRRWSGAGIAKNQEECLQDIAAMSRKISPLKNAMEYELGIRDGLHADKQKTQLAMCDNYRRSQKYTKKGGRGKDGKQYTILVPTHKKLTERPLTPPTPNDEEE